VSAIVMPPKGQCPHPGRADRRHIGFEDAADNNATCQRVEIVIVPLAGRLACFSLALRIRES
jgi:hypothetical protein